MDAFRSLLKPKAPTHISLGISDKNAKFAYQIALVILAIRANPSATYGTLFENLGDNIFHFPLMTS